MWATTPLITGDITEFAMGVPLAQYLCLLLPTRSSPVRLSPTCRSHLWGNFPAASGYLLLEEAFSNPYWFNYIITLGHRVARMQLPSVIPTGQIPACWVMVIAAAIFINPAKGLESSQWSVFSHCLGLWLKASAGGWEKEAKRIKIGSGCVERSLRKPSSLSCIPLENNGVKTKHISGWESERQVSAWVSF